MGSSKMRLFEYTNKQAAYFDDTQLTSARCRYREVDLAKQSGEVAMQIATHTYLLWMWSEVK